ncbi:CST complex subunit CTC1 [Ctenopharyngodon idella]|uniref:CST complex subunit CTC1 n=1 Tax=Ctenopharyngodon idella TaxID=7959 RepID=UPI00222FC507|nr:CST complex subunit CTC1 [Ctenopharyngodon idella]
MEEFLKHFKNHSRAEQRWLSEVFEGVRQQLHPLIDSSLGLSVVRLSLAVVSKVQRAVGSDSSDLPVSYRLVSVSELTREQRTACCSSLSWSSAHYRERARGAEQMLPDFKALPRDNLLLIGFLCDGRAAGTSDGVWRVRDAGGSVSCTMLKSSCLWLGRLMLFPTWNYIPQNAPAAGYLELIDSPVCVTLEAMAFDPGGTLSEVMSVTRAAELLRQRCEDQVYVCVSGQVSVVCPLLLIGGKRFFCLILSEGGSSVPVFITEAKHQYWRQCVCVGQSVWISSLRVCSLQGLEGRCVLSDSCQSRLHPQESSEEPETHTDTSDAHTHLPSGSASAVRVKRSTLISFKGTITKILNAEAGLYEIDRQVGLCLAYQPAQKWGGGLRPGAEIQLHNVHFTYHASPFAPRVVLCACLRSSVQISSFSPLSSKVEVSGSHSPLQCLLLEKNLGASQYLWLCYCQSAVTERLCPRWVRAERVCVVAGRLLDFVCDAEQKTQKKRNIYREMIQEPHQCPVTTYCVCWPSVALWSVKQLCDWMSREVWACLSLPALLPPSAAHMTAVELNAPLSWSSHTVPLEHASSEPLLLVGVLELDSTRATLQLRDQTHALDCVCVQTGQSGARTSDIDTAWQGCLVCVRQCTLVMERFMKTHFPSWKHLDQPSYITHKHCRVYLQLCVDDLTIISPSAAMSRRLSERRDRPEKSRDGGTSEIPKRPRADDAADTRTSKRPLTPAPCVSLLLRLESKQGVTLQNGSGDAHRLQLGFVCRATCLGDVQRWDNDPKNCRTQERERDGDHQKIELHFIGLCVRWFPVLHPGCVYRLIALNTEDVSVLKAKAVSARGGVTQLSSPALLLQPQWRMHTLTDELPDAQSGVPALMSVSEVLHSSSAPDIVSFYGVLSQRITLQEDSGTKPKIQSLTAAEDPNTEEDLRVRLTVQDAECPGQVIDVYLDLSCGPYTHGLIAGAALQIHHAQRKVSRACNVYCRSLPISRVTVTDLSSVRSGSGASQSPPPMMLLGEWASARTQRGVVGKVKGHVVRVLSLRLQWTCSLCGSIFKQMSCGRTHPPCDSTSAVFQAEAKVVVEDGSGEAHVWFSSDTVCDLLMLNAGQWEGLQRHIRVKGHVKVYTRGYNMMCDEDPDDSLVQYLNCVCSSAAVCRQIHLTCRIRAQRTGKPQLRKVHRGQTEFICKFAPALQLQCQHIHTR